MYNPVSFTAIALMAIGLVCAALPLSAKAQGRAAGVLVDTADEREIRDTQAVIGQLVATRRAQVASRIAGVIDTVSFDIGNSVKKGQALVSLDKTRIAIERNVSQASVEAAEAGIRVAQAKLQLAEQAFQRQAALRKSTAFSKSRYDDLQQEAEQARSEAAQERAELETAKSNLERAKYELKHATIVAPFDGIIIARQAQPGQYVNIGGAVATLLDISNLEVEADVPSNIANNLAPGAKITAIFDGGTRKNLELRSIIPVQNVSTRTRPVRFTARISDLQESHIAVGSTVTLQMPVSAPRKVVSVPKDALLQARGSWIVYVVQDGKAMPRPVELGQSVSGRIEIVSGLKVGEMVVVRGNERLRPGQEVKPLQADAEVPGTQAKTQARPQG